MRRARKILATLLTFAMLFGSSLTVFAEEYEWKDLIEGQELHNGDKIIVTEETVQEKWIGCKAILVVNDVEQGSAVYHKYGQDGGSTSIKLSYTINVAEDKVWKVISKDYVVADPDSTPPKAKYCVNGSESNAVPSTNPTPSSNPVEEPTKIEEVHEHSYSWVTVQEATTEQDGIEEYRCSCGDVKERSVIPASQALVSGLFDIVKNASLNGVAQYDSGRLYTMSDYIIKKLAERSDVTTVITFEYNKTAYKMTIPAGVDYSAILADDDYFYGYFYFAKITGSTIEEIN